MKIDNSEYRLAFKCVTRDYKSVFVSNTPFKALIKEYLSGTVVRGYKNLPLYTTVDVTADDTEIAAYCDYEKVMLVRFRLKDCVVGTPAYRVYLPNHAIYLALSAVATRRFIRTKYKHSLEYDYRGVTVNKLDVLEEVDMTKFTSSHAALKHYEDKYGIKRYELPTK